MQFALEVVVLECSFLKHSQGILGIKTFALHKVEGFDIMLQN
jgi:hypothetical protein